MNIAEFSIKHKSVMWLIVVLIAVGGFFAYENIGRLEDPEFTIKDAMVFTPYPGASAQEVDEEVTEMLERVIQEMPQVKEIKSVSKPGMSEITVSMKNKYDKNSLPQIWDELRRKVNDNQSQLPPGAAPSRVNDDYGDVYGMLYAITGEGFNFREMDDLTDKLKTELSLIPGVAKVIVEGKQKEMIYFDVSRTKMAQLGISLQQISQTLKSQNVVTPSGAVKIDDEYIRIEPSGSFNSVDEISNLLILSHTSNKLIRLSDLGDIYRGYQEVPDELIYYNGKPALALGISATPEANVVKVGEAINAKIASLQSQIPVGISIKSIYSQPTEVTRSINSFISSLYQALAIVVIVLLLFMGLKSGVIIAAVLLLTIGATLLIMYLMGISLERISLGALIIALGMLVDNAIVIAEGILVSTERGINKLKAAVQIVEQTKWPLLGATVIGILAFAPIGLSQDSTGEYTRSLFYVILISMLISWLLAISITPLFCHHLLKKPKTISDKAPYSNLFYRSYKGLLLGCLHFRWLTLALMVGLLTSAVYGFAYVKQSFFPDATTPIFYVDYWRNQGTDIRTTKDDMLEIEQYILQQEGVENVSIFVGQGAPRFMLVYSPENPNPSFGQFIVKVDEYERIERLSEQIKNYIIARYPNSEPKIKRVVLGTGGGAKIEARISGADPNVLRGIANQIQEIMRNNPNAIDVRDNWRHRVKILEPIFSTLKARETGVSREELANTLQMAFSGYQLGLYREGKHLIPIVTRPPANERLNVETIRDLQIWSPLVSEWIPISQVVSRFQTIWQDSRIHRFDRRLTITVESDPAEGTASQLFNELRPQIEDIPLPSGYQLQWGGEFESSTDAQAALASQLPWGGMAMFLVLVLLFKALRQPIMIFLCVPLAFVGVTFGLLMSNMEFGFMALLGFLSLSGMLIKNAIVLVDQIDLEIKEGKEKFLAIIDSSLSRVRPVSLAAVTTVLGMIPLLRDVFFQSMAVVIMFGITFATILTLLIIPVFYAMFFNIKFRRI